MFDHPEALHDAMHWIVQQTPPAPTHFLATVLALATDAAADRQALDRMASRYGGWPAGPALAWSFDGPQRAIRCAHAMLAFGGRSSNIRAGIHAGEVRRTQGALRGEGLDTAFAVAAAARRGEVRVSQVVRDLVHGGALSFGAGSDVHLADGRTIAKLTSTPAAQISQR